MAFNLLCHLKAYPDLDLGIIILNEGKLAEKLRSCGVAVHVIDEKLLSFRDIVQRSRSIIRSSTPDVIHSHRYKENILATLAAGFNGSIRLIATQHGLPESAGRKTTLASQLVSKANYHLLSRYFTKTVAVSEDVRNFLVQQHAFSEESVDSIHNGIEVPDTIPSNRRSGEFVIGSSGRLFPVKDYPLMIKIAQAIASTNATDVYFELAGEGPERSMLESMLQHHGLQSRFILRGHQEDMDSYYQGIDLYLNTSLHEGIPMTILEALARGIPVIAPSVGGISEIITNGIEGFLIKSRQPEAFAEKCLLLRDNVELRKKMSVAARDRAEQAFSAEKMAAGYYRLYHNNGSQTRQWLRSDTGCMSQQ